MRTSITKNELKVFTFPMTDNDILARVEDINKLREQSEDLERKKKLIQQEIKSLKEEMDQMFANISRKEEPREVECQIVLDYKDRVVSTLFEGEEMETSKMSEWQYSTRPEDIYPEIKKSKVEESETTETPIEAALKRADEIKAKSENIVAPATNVNAFSEAKTETSVINSPLS